MKNLTDIFIRRPVLACVISLFILLFGLRALTELKIRQFPKIESAIVQIQTAYPGANPELIQSFLTSPIQKAIASADGIDYLTSQTTEGLSTITAHLTLNYPINKAFTNILAKVSQIKNALPERAKDPIVTKNNVENVAQLYLAFTSETLTQGEITDYVSRNIQPILETIDGVGSATILGEKEFAMRVWLDPHKMSAMDVTASDIAQALAQKNVQAPVGGLTGDFISFSLSAQTGLHTVNQFNNLILKRSGNRLIQLKDVARVELGAQNYESTVTFNGKEAIFIGIDPLPSANPLSLIKRVRTQLPSLKAKLPDNIKMEVAYDATNFIRASINEVFKSIFEACLIVVAVIFCFLGSFRAIVIPVITIPLSLIGVCMFLLFLGYSINTLTLLAMVLAIGLVVDDAIVVLENIHRHIEKGLTPMNAAVKGASEIVVPIITMTLTLAAVYAPIAFLHGLTATLFKEFAITLSCAVIISGVIAITLSPMMCSKILKSSQEGRFERFINSNFMRLENRFEQNLKSTLSFRLPVVILAVTVFISIGFLYLATPKEMAPAEDTGFFGISGQAPASANHAYAHHYASQINQALSDFPEKDAYFTIETGKDVFAGLILKPNDQRQKPQSDYSPLLNEKMQNIIGLRVFSFNPPPLPGTEGLPVQFVVTSNESAKTMYPYVQELIDKANKSGLFWFVDQDFKYNKPKIDIHIDRELAGDLGISMQSIASALMTSLSPSSVNRFSMHNRSYEVIPQLEQQYRDSPSEINYIEVRSHSGALVPLSALIQTKLLIEPNALSTFQQLNSITIQGMIPPYLPLGTALNFLNTEANKIFPKSFNIHYAGQSRQYIQEGASMLYAFFFAFIVIFLLLSAQFESFRDPFIILISVPLSICGALIPLHLGLASINVYTQVGLITLIGLISKHGILMVDFANHLREEQPLSRIEAITRAAKIRLRPILMTTAAMVCGVMPLLLADGAGAVSRFNIGLVITSGLLIGTLFTLFVVPTMYTIFAKKNLSSGDLP